MNKVFDKKNIILLKIDENDLISFLLKMDIDDNGQPLYPLDIFSEELINIIPEYVFAQYENPSIPQTDVINKMREAASAIYRIKEYDLMRKVYLSDDKDVIAEATKELDSLPYRNRGEFGELLLHFILRDFKGTIPLVSKVYFKDSSGVPAHGFDAVHISPEEKILWLGESKLYVKGQDGIKALISDLVDHVKTDYLNEQFIIIKKNLKNNSIPQRDEWINNLSSANLLSEKLKMINIPLLCIYENDVYDKFSDTDSPEVEEYHTLNIRELKQYFDDKNTHPLKQKLNIILILLPIKNKADLIKKLHERLWHMQNI